MNEKKATGNITNNFALQDHLPAVVLNKIIEAVLYLEANAQDNQDNNLQTTDKTILGAINEIVSSMKLAMYGKDVTPTDSSNFEFYPREKNGEIYGYYIGRNGSRTYTGEIIIPYKYNGKPVVGLQNAAFQGTGVTSVILPKTIKRIGNHAFENCTSLLSIEIPDSAIAMGDSVFNGCTSLLSIIIPDSVNVPSNDVSYPSDSRWWFSGCSALKFVKLGNGIKYLAGSCFNGCSSLETIEIPTGVLGVGASADGTPSDQTFTNCPNLKKVIIPDSVISFGNAWFNGSSNAVVYCNKGSQAESFCIDKNIPYIVPVDSDDLETKQDKSNPTGTGAVSINRKSSTDVGRNSTTFGTDSASTEDNAFAAGDNVTSYNDGAASFGLSDNNVFDETTQAERDDAVDEENRNPVALIAKWLVNKFSFNGGKGGFIFGTNCLNLGKNGLAGGNGCINENNSGVSLGTGCHNKGKYGLAGGLESETDENYGFTWGYRLKSIKKCMAVFGRLNDYTSRSDLLFALGNGKEQNGVVTRSNAFEVDEQGKAYGYGTLTGSESDKVLTNLQYLRKYFPVRKICKLNADVDTAFDAGLYQVDFSYPLKPKGEYTYGEMISIPYVSQETGRNFGAQLFFATGDYSDERKNCFWYRTYDGGNSTWNAWVKVDPLEIQSKISSLEQRIAALEQQ